MASEKPNQNDSYGLERVMEGDEGAGDVVQQVQPPESPASEAQSVEQIEPPEATVKGEENQMAAATPPTATPGKIMVVLCPVGGAPILKRRRWEVDSTQTVHFITSFIRKKLELHKSDSLFVYVNQSFAPSPDQSVRNLFDCFGSDGKLVLAYCRTPAWG